MALRGWVVAVVSGMAAWKWALILIVIAIPIVGEYWVLPQWQKGQYPIDAAWCEHWHEIKPTLAKDCPLTLTPRHP